LESRGKKSIADLMISDNPTTIVQRADAPYDLAGDSTKISLVDLFGLSEFAWLAFRYHPALG